MIIDHPKDLKQLKLLWQEAFGDPEEAIHDFFDTAFSREKCFCALEGDEVLGALYVLDCRFDRQRIAYIYAVATKKSARGRGVCRKLTQEACKTLKDRGYAGAILVPADEGLFKMYEKLGFAPCSSIREFTCNRSGRAELQGIGPEEYAALREKLLPSGSVIQEGATLSYLATFARFYKGQDFICVGYLMDDHLFVPEILGNTQAAAGILGALGAEKGTFRTPGEGRVFTSYQAFSENGPAPGYFGLALDEM